MGSSNAIQRSPVPPGAFVEVDVTNISEGDFVAEVNEKVRKAMSELFDYEKRTGDMGGLIEVTAKIKVSRFPNTKNLFNIETQVTSKIPVLTRASEATERGGKLLCQPVGTNDDAEQQLFYDGQGRVIGADGRPVLIEQDDDEHKPLKMPRTAQG
jgi:hypothetical protein